MRELSLNIMDIVQNSISANATLIQIDITENLNLGTLCIVIADNGKGMTKEQVQSVTDPFYTTRTTRPVGLGIPLFKMEAEMTGGGLQIQSEKGVGTTLTATFVAGHIDMVPLGDINATILPLVTGNPQLDFVYSRKRLGANGEAGFVLDTKEIKSVLGQEVSLSAPDVVLWLKEFLAENTGEILQTK